MDTIDTMRAQQARQRKMLENHLAGNNIRGTSISPLPIIPPAHRKLRSLSEYRREKKEKAYREQVTIRTINNLYELFPMRPKKMTRPRTDGDAA